MVPNTDNYKQALRYYADKAEFPIMPSYTANQRDKAEAAASGAAASNNFSNINSTLQARLYSKALREYPSQYITPDMYRKLLEWVTLTEYVNGDNRYPDNNEFFFNWNPTRRRRSGRSGHPPQHPRRVQHDDPRRHRRHAARGWTTRWSCGRSTSAGTTTRSTTSATTAPT